MDKLSHTPPKESNKRSESKQEALQEESVFGSLNPTGYGDFEKSGRCLGF